jgi:outer membrane protein assembly factor BamB
MVVVSVSKGKFTAGIVIVILVFSAASPLIHLELGMNVHAESGGIEDDWPMFRHDPQRTGYSTSTAPSTNETKWFYNVTTEIDSAPAVANGRVIVGLSSGVVIAVNSTTGEKLWSFDTYAGSNSIWSSPAIDSGKVYIGNRDCNLYCLNESTGVLRWKYLTGKEINSSPLVSDGKVFFGSMDGKLYCLNADAGSLIWNFTTSGDGYGNVGVHSSPSILDDVVFVGSLYGAKLYAVNASTGVKIWDFSVNGVIFSSPSVYDGKVFFNADYAGVYCLNATDGALIWNTPDAISFVYSSLAVADGRVFIGDSENKFYCFDASTGVSLWNFTNIAAVWSSAAVADGKVFFGTENGWFYCLDENTGNQIWSYRALDRVASSPAVSDGTVFVGCGSGWLGVGGLYAFGKKYSLPTSLSLFLNSDTALLGFKVRINGTLTGNGAAIQGVSVLLSYSVTGGQTWNDITAVPTTADGSYYAVWQPSATGTYLVRASWAPYYPYEVAESTRMFSVNTFDEQNVFSVVSNSTVSTLAFNSTSNELSFTVSGPDGTTGFVDLTVAKDLVDNIAELRVYLDGASLSYTTTPTANSWLLHFNYAHSTHSVFVSLGTFVIPEFSAWLFLPPVPIVLLLSVVIKKRRKQILGKRNQASLGN